MRVVWYQGYWCPEPKAGHFSSRKYVPVTLVYTTRFPLVRSMYISWAFRDPAGERVYLHFTDYERNQKSTFF